MNLEEALTAYLLSRSALTALIGRRLFYDELPQGTEHPAVVCQAIDNIPINTHDGRSTFESPNYQWTVYAVSRASARTVAEQLKAALCDYSGTMSGLTIQYIRLINDIASTEKSADGTVRLATVDLEFEINYNRE